MENIILEEIKEFARNKLIQKYGFCGEASGSEMAMLSSIDENDNDIIINIKCVKEVTKG